MPTDPPSVLTPATRAWEDVLAHIERELLAGTLSPGDHLPSERTLAAHLGVGRSSVREALRVLEVLGLLRTQTGSGPESGAIIIARPSGGMSSLIRLQVAAQGFRVDDVVSTRLILETAIAGQLAESVQGGWMPDLAPALELLDAMEAGAARAGAIDSGAIDSGAIDSGAIDSGATDSGATEPGATQAGARPSAGPEPTPREFLALDAQFHFSLAVAAGNPVIAATMTGLRDSIESYSIAGVAHLESWPATAARLKREHRAIVAAIESGDPAAARATVNSHITGYYAEAGFGHPPAAPARQQGRERGHGRPSAPATAAARIHLADARTQTPEHSTKGTTHG